ncbi:hypothetical protein SDJN02_18285 [Cucurbita argyrosperma subsp. argyrosperma]|nr:hypothetical protein SDJN02_18285 [Cucurbita argyrosperma subsp. argyrosperma]
MMIGSGNNLNRGSAFVPSNMPSLPQCLPLEPITLGNQKISCSGELKKALGVSSGNGLEDRPFGVVHLKRQPPVASKEMKHFKDSVQDSSRRARERADMLSESLFKLDKYREAMSSKKRQRTEISPSERLGGGNLSKLGSQIQRNGHDVVIYRLEGRAKSVGLNKRARSSISDVQQPESRFTTITSNTTFLEKDNDDGSLRSEEKTRKLLAGGEGLDQKVKKKRSVGAVGYRINNGNREIKRPTQTKLHSDSKLRSCDAQRHRPKSSSGVNGMNRLDGTSNPTSSDASTISKNELESSFPLKGRTYILEQRMLKGNNRPSNREDNSVGSHCTVIKAKVSRGPRTGSVVGLDSSPNINCSSETHQTWESASVGKAQMTGLSSNPKHALPTGSHPVTQWVGQRHKNSRSRRSKLLPPVPDHGEIPSPSQEFAASDFGQRTNATNGSVLATSVDINTMKFKKEVDNVSSPSGISESEESGPGDDKVKRKDASSGKFSLSAVAEAGSSIFPVRKNRVLANEKGDGVRRQGRNGRGPIQVKPDSPLVRDKSERPFAEKPLRNMKPMSGKIRSKSGRPPSKKLKDRKGSAHVGLTCRSTDITGESDDDQEELFEAANSARNANVRACTGPFWQKVNSIFDSVSPADAANLKQQLSLAEELGERLYQMQVIEHDNLDLGVHVTETNCSEEIRGSNLSKEFTLSGAKGGKFDVGRLDKAVPLYHRVLSALIEERDCDEYYHQSEGKHTFLQSTSDDSHCGSCNLNDYEHRDRVESEAESTIDFQISKNMFDRFSYDRTARTARTAVSNSYRNPSMSNFIHGGEQWRGEDDLSHGDVGHASEICSNDSFQLQYRDLNVPNVSSNCQYQMMQLNDKLLLELQSIGLYPETLPDLAEGEDLINQEIMEHKRSLCQQIERKRRNLEKVEQSIQRGEVVEKREVEKVAMDKLVEMAYSRKMGYRGSSASKSTVRRVSKLAARSFMKRTLTRCHEFEDSGISCFSEPALQDIIFSTPSSKRDTKTVDFCGSTTTNTFFEASHQMDDRGLGAAVFGPSERYDSQSDTVDKGSSNAQAINSSEQHSMRGSMMTMIKQKKKKREMRIIDEVAGSASSMLTSGLSPGTKGKRSERERDPNKNHPLSDIFGPSLDGCQGARRSRANPRQKGSCLSTTSAASRSEKNQLSEVPKFGDRSRASLGSLKDEAEESSGLSNLQLHDIDGMEELDDVSKDLGSWLDIDEDGLQDHDDDGIGLEIPMDDLSELNMLV